MNPPRGADPVDLHPLPPLSVAGRLDRARAALAALGIVGRESRRCW